jgi:hypothetical protein
MCAWYDVLMVLNGISKHVFILVNNATTCMCACVLVCMCACVHVCLCACVHVCMCACAHGM